MIAQSHMPYQPKYDLLQSYSTLAKNMTTGVIYHLGFFAFVRVAQKKVKLSRIYSKYTPCWQNMANYG